MPQTPSPFRPVGAGLEAFNALPTPPREKYHLCVHASRNNTILHFTDAKGNSTPGGRITSGMLGFKKVQRGQFEAGFQCAMKVMARIEQEAEGKKVRITRQPSRSYHDEENQDADSPQWDPGMEVEVIFKGFGQGREALYQALMTSQGAIVRPLISRLTDRTPIKVGGTRSKKARRL